MDGPPPGPKWMRWQTYERKAARLEHYNAGFDGAWAELRNESRIAPHAKKLVDRTRRGLQTTDEEVGARAPLMHDTLIYRPLVVVLGAFLLFLGAAELRLARASCDLVPDRMQHGYCWAKQIEVDTAFRSPEERIKAYEVALERLPDNYLLALKLAEAYAADGDKRSALPLFDRAATLVRQQHPEVADQILEQKKNLRSVSTP